MVKTVDDLLKDIVELIHDKEELLKQLSEANEVTDGIRNGSIDAVLITNNDIARILVSKTADHAYRKFIENMSEGVVTLQTDGIILYGNSSFATLVDLPLGQVIGKNILTLIPIEFIIDFERFFKHDSQNNSKFELSIPGAKGKQAHFIVSLNILQLQDFVAHNLVWTDVTEQKGTERKLIEANENLNEANIELSTFAHIASHDLQEPLRKIATYSSMLKNDYYNEIDIVGHGYIDKILGSSIRMRSLINDILKYSEISQKKLVLESTDLGEVIQEILSDLEIVIKETKAEIIIENELPFIIGNYSQMRQLFQNLLSNSLKFISADKIPQIVITYMTCEGKEIDQIEEGRLNEPFHKIQIKDNGIGFDSEYIDKIFTIFQRLNNNAVYPGTGIGLAICKKIVEKHEGFIAAESNPGEGALFTIYIPVSQENQVKGI